MLDKLPRIEYDNQARERVGYDRRRVNAMNREIADRSSGNFRGVCPRIGRLRMDQNAGVDRRAMIGTGQSFLPVFFMSRNDTHGTAGKKDSHCTARGQNQTVHY